MTLSLPPPLSNRQAPNDLLRVTALPAEQGLSLDNDHNNIGFDDDLDLSHHLPPPTPPLDPVPED